MRRKQTGVSRGVIPPVGNAGQLPGGGSDGESEREEDVSDAYNPLGTLFLINCTTENTGGAGRGRIR